MDIFKFLFVIFSLLFLLVASINAKKKTSAVAGAVVGAAAGAYVTHKVHKNLDQSERKVVKVKSRTTRRPSLKIKHVHLAIVTRSEWNANRLSEINIRPGDSFSKVIVHHTSSADCYDMTTCIAVLKAVERRNIEVKKLDNIGYNFMIGGDGRIYENLAWAMYSKILNISSIDHISLHVAFIGDFSVYRPNERQMDAFEALISSGDNKNLLKKYRIHGHRDVSCTNCPGDVLYSLIKNFERYQPLLDTATLCGAGR